MQNHLEIIPNLTTGSTTWAGISNQATAVFKLGHEGSKQASTHFRGSFHTGVLLFKVVGAVVQFPAATGADLGCEPATLDVLVLYADQGFQSLGHYLGDRSPGDVSHSSACAATSSWRSLVNNASRAGPGSAVASSASARFFSSTIRSAKE
jgi:hypothetical protein